MLYHNSTELQSEMDELQSIKYSINIVVVFIIVLASLGVFIVVLKRRRTETFILSIPFLFSTYGILSIILYFHLQGWDHNNIRFFNTKHGQQVLISISNFSFAIAYWIFAFQYLRTSLILPKLLIDQQVNKLIDNDISDGPNFLKNDYKIYKQVIDEQR